MSRDYGIGLDGDVLVGLEGVDLVLGELGTVWWCQSSVPGVADDKFQLT